MASTSIGAQLKSFKLLVKSDTEIPRRPFTKPTILYDPKDAADIDLDQIFDLASTGLEVLVNIDERFRNYKNDLFDLKGKEVDRELVAVEENNRIDATISSYLRLLSAYLQSPSAFKTLEYLIRRYKIHVYNSEELILCSLPYHDTHAFVRIVQLIDFSGTQWKFLGGVKASGAPPPREVIVQQCIRDMGVLESICNYAIPTKKHQPSTPVISFSTAVVVEVLGSLATVNTDIVMRILPFVNSGLQCDGKGSAEYKAGTLMIVGLLAKRSALSTKLVSSLVRSVAELAHVDAQVSGDTQWVELSIKALVNIVQLQSVVTLPKKAVDILKEIKDLPGILSQLTTRFNIDKFLMLLLDSLIDYSSSDSCCKRAVVLIIKTISIKDLVKGAVFRLFSSCLRLSKNADVLEVSESGSWTKQILLLLDKKYPVELRTAVHEFLNNKKMQPKGEGFVIESLCKILDGNSNSTVGFSDTKIWFALEHPKAEMRRSAFSNLDLSIILNGNVTSERLVNVQDAVGRGLLDDDLSVVQAALSHDKLLELIDSAHFLAMSRTLIRRCTGILWSNTSKDHYLAGEVAVSCLKHLVSMTSHRSDLSEEIAMLVLPLLLVFPQTKMLNLKALELKKDIKWPFYRDLLSVSDMKSKVGKEQFSVVNMLIVRSLVNVLSTDSEKFFPWLIKCCSESDLSKTLCFMVLMESFEMQKNTSIQFGDSNLYEACFAFLKAEWISLEHARDFSCAQGFNSKVLNADDLHLLDEFDASNIKNWNGKILVFVFWRLMKAYISLMPADIKVDDDKEWGSTLRELYIFFAESSMKHLFKEHRHYLVQNGKFSPVPFISSFISAQGISSQVQVESLHLLTVLCSQADERSSLELLAGFPLILVPLSSDVQDVRTGAMIYVEELSSLSSRVKYASKKNGNSEFWGFFLDKLLRLLVQQKKLILSDKDFLPSLLVSILSPSFHSLMVPLDIGQSFEKSTTEGILSFILVSTMEFSGYAKLKVLSLLKELGGTIMCVKNVHSLLCDLLQRRSGYQELSSIDLDILCLLIEICSMPTSLDIRVVEDHLLPALWIGNMVPGDVALVRPCVTFLENLNEKLYKSLSAEMQLNLFKQLVVLYHDENNDVQNAAKEALLRLNVSCSTVSKVLDSVAVSEIGPVDSSDQKTKKSKKHKTDVFFKGKNGLRYLSSLLDVILLKKDMDSRAFLLEPLFQVLKKVFFCAPAVSSEEWVLSLSYIQQTLLLILEDIIVSLPTDGSLSKAVFDKFDAALLVDCARRTTDFTTCNHVYSLFAAISKVATDKVLDLVPEILGVLGKSTVGHDDTHSKRVFEDFILTVVPCWLSKMDATEQLLQIFVDLMPDVVQHRRLSIVLHLLRTLGESNSLGSLLVLLFRSLVFKGKMSSVDYDTEWEFNFAEQICEQYTCMIWLPSLVSMLKQLQGFPQDHDLFSMLLSALKFILVKLQDPELVLKLQSLEDIDTIQGTLNELMVQAVLCWQLVDLSRKKISLPASLKKDLKELVHSVVMKISKGMTPSTFFRSISNLLVQAEKSAKKKALQVLCETVRDSDVLKSKRTRGHNLNVIGSWHHVSGSDLESFATLCLEILQLLDGSHDDINVPVKLAAISALEVLANKFPSNHTVFSKCLTSVVRNVVSDDLAVVSGGLRAASTLISVLGPRALPELPQIMKNILKITRDSSYASSNDTVMLSLLMTLEALVENLGAFLSPYLHDVIELLVLRSDCISESNAKLKLKADGVRKLLSEKVPVRLALPAMQNVYAKAIQSGDMSFSAVFELLKNFVSNMDRSSVSGYHTNIFDFCMLALDLRSQHSAKFEDINAVEKHVINAMVSLSMKMTESMFKPLFIRSIEWVESKTDENDHAGGRNVSRAVSFYGLVNMLAENHRSLFVPYFKYLIDGCIKYLTDDVGHSRKKKKAKLQKPEDGKIDTNKVSSLEKWHLRSLILSSLHKCFLYDTRYDAGSLKFMDSSKFHLLLKPIVSQLAIDPPASLKDYRGLPSVEEVDDILVSCLGQMATTSGSDLLWKPLNYEVLMQTRSEYVRTRLLSLRIVKHLVENLKEEFLVLLAETIPFLAELLEDIDLPVKTLAQEILKELETMSGENLREYF